MRYGDNLLGLYQGVSKNLQGRGFRNNLSDKITITIFRKPIESIASDPEEFRKIIKKLIYYEIAHHFGFDERGARKLESKVKD